MSTCPVIDFLNSPFVSAFCGGLIGGIFTYAAVKITIDNEKDKTRTQDNKEIKAICLAIETEIKCLIDRYQESVGNELFKCEDGTLFDCYYPADQEYFTVFHANTAWIGKIKSDETRKSIVVTYIAMKGLIDSYQQNNRMLNDYIAHLQQAASLPQAAGVQQKFYNDLKTGFEKQLIDYLPTLKEAHANTNKKASEALGLLREYIQSIETNA